VVNCDEGDEVVDDDDDEDEGMAGHCFSMNSNFCANDVVSPDLT